MRITVVSQVEGVPCENRNVTSSEGIDLLPGSLDNLFSALCVKILCGKLNSFGFKLLW